MTVSEFLRLIRLKYHITLNVVLLGFAYGQRFALHDWVRLFEVVFFFIVMYSGLYILNDVADYERDMNNEDKRQVSPLLKGKITRQQATILAIGFIAAGIAGMSLYGSIFTFLAFGFLLINVLYTHILKKIAYVEFLANALTYPLRFWMGYSISREIVMNPEFFWLTILALAATMIFAVTRRYFELQHKKDLSIRPTLRHYTLSGLLKLKVALVVVCVVLVLFESIPWYFALLVVIILPLELLISVKYPGYLTFYRMMGK